MLSPVKVHHWGMGRLRPTREFFDEMERFCYMSKIYR